MIMITLRFFIYLCCNLCLGSASDIVDEIVERRDRMKHSGCAWSDMYAPFPRPRDDGAHIPPCKGSGILVRRDMGSLGVSSFQQVYGALAADALGPQFKYYDEWPMAAGLLKKGVQHETSDANNLLQQMQVTAIKPHLQDELNTKPWNMTDDVARRWVEDLRRVGCKQNALISGVRIQGHFQHIGYFKRYREFIHRCILKSPAEFRADYYKPVLSTYSGHRHGESTSQPIADLVVYLRLGDKSVAGDTILTFESGYYHEVLKARRPDHKTCWIVTNSIGDKRAKELASLFSCDLQSSDHYSDWTTMYLAPRTLVMAASTFIYFQALVGAAKEIHYPAVGFFHDKHNVCMRRKKEDSHFGQIRLPFGLIEDNDVKQVFYHDIYSRQFFLSYAQLSDQAAALPCGAILDQHVCADTDKPDNYRESRYCYKRESPSTIAAAKLALTDAMKIGEITRKRSKHGSRNGKRRHSHSQ